MPPPGKKGAKARIFSRQVARVCVDMGSIALLLGLAASPVAASADAAPITFLSAFQASSAVVEATATTCLTEYAAATGPRQSVTFQLNVLHLGTSPGTTFTTKVFGGPAPALGAEWIEVSETPQIICGKRYLLFLKKVGWFYSPFAQPPLRVETAFSKTFFVDESGAPVTGVTTGGYEVFEEQVFVPTVEITTPFAARPLNPAASSSWVADAKNPSTITSWIVNYAADKGVTVAGVYAANPSSTDWQNIAVAAESGWSPCPTPPGTCGSEP